MNHAASSVDSIVALVATFQFSGDNFDQTMPRKSFEEAVAEVRRRDQRFPADAYTFLRDALDFTIRSLGREESGEDRHVNGPQLLAGFRDYAIREFGPMVPVVLADWGITCTEDVGRMVFNLIEVGVFGKSEEDSIDDFRDVFDFNDAFVVPFRPKARGVEPGGGSGANRGARRADSDPQPRKETHDHGQDS